VITKIVSGGQTGADRAALDWAIANGIAHGGWCPLGRRAEDGPIAARYALTETGTRDYRERTRRNVRDSDATLIVNLGALDGGSLETHHIAEALGKPHLVVQADNGITDAAISAVRNWLADARPQTLNVAGPRESGRPGIGALTRELLERAFGEPRTR
jgi:Circularly permutated YpsA SLOG family